MSKSRLVPSNLTSMTNKSNKKFLRKLKLSALKLCLKNLIDIFLSLLSIQKIEMYSHQKMQLLKFFCPLFLATTVEGLTKLHCKSSEKFFSV